MVAGRWRVVDAQPVDFELGELIARHREAARDFA